MRWPTNICKNVNLIQFENGQDEAENLLELQPTGKNTMHINQSTYAWLYCWDKTYVKNILDATPEVPVGDCYYELGRARASQAAQHFG
jgi:hypothetical protein